MGLIERKGAWVREGQIRHGDPDADLAEKAHRHDPMERHGNDPVALD